MPDDADLSGQREHNDYILSKDAKRQGVQLFYLIVSQKFKEKGGVSRCEIAQEQIDGERASVTFRCHYKNGKSDGNRFPLLLEDGKWRIRL
jgi:Domain of unknown function (DUF4878)